MRRDQPQFAAAHSATAYLGNERDLMETSPAHQTKPRLRRLRPHTTAYRRSEGRIGPPSRERRLERPNRLRASLETTAHDASRGERSIWFDPGPVPEALRRPATATV
jgi:hypothetical protein